MIGRHVAQENLSEAQKRHAHTIIGIIASVTICLLTYLFIEPIITFTTNAEVISIAVLAYFSLKIVLETARGQYDLVAL